MTDTLPAFDPHNPDYFVTGLPFDLLAELRQQGPVAKTPLGYYLTRRQEADELLYAVDTYGSDMTPGTGLTGVEEVPEEQLFLPEIDEPVHGQIRRLYNSALGPHRTMRIQPFVRQTCERLLDALMGEDPADLHADYAVPIPCEVIAHIIGLPEGGADKLKVWSSDGSVMFRAVCPQYAPDGPPITGYLKDLVAQQRLADEPSSHTYKVFLDAEIEGEPLSDTVIAHQLQTMVLGGVHTTRGLLAHSMHRLIVEPDTWAALEADRELIPVFVEESLRHDSPAPRVARRCLKDTSLGGVDMQQGDWVEVGLASANRDAAQYEDPEDFRLDRPDPLNHVAFGAGAHVCPGASLARLEGVTAIETLLDRVAALTPVAGFEYPPLPANLAYSDLSAQITWR